MSVVNMVVGAGIFVLPGLVAAELGSAAILAYLICSVTVAARSWIADSATINSPVWASAAELRKHATARRANRILGIGDID